MIYAFFALFTPLLKKSIRDNNNNNKSLATASMTGYINKNQSKLSRVMRYKQTNFVSQYPLNQKYLPLS